MNDSAGGKESRGTSDRWFLHWRGLSGLLPKYGCEFRQFPQRRTIFSIGWPGRYTSGCGQEFPAWIPGGITSGPPSVWGSEYGDVPTEANLITMSPYFGNRTLVDQPVRVLHAWPIRFGDSPR